MANPTTNYGFVLPTATDLVTDLPADFDVALQGVDTRLKALQPGTTLGDIVYSSATANTNTRLGVGSAGNVLTISGGVPVWATPASGKVLQVVYGSTSTEKAVSNTTWADSNLTASITPTLATSKVLVMVAQNGAYIGPGAATNALQVKLLRGATDLITFATRASGDDAAIQRFGDTVSTVYLDSPATTSATTYKTQIRNYNNAAEVRVQVDNNVTSTIILMEIGV